MKASRWSARLTLPVMAGRDHMRGPASAAVTLLEYGDYECPCCRAAHDVLTTIQATLQNRLCYVFRHFPLTTAHPLAQAAAEAAEAAGSQDRFWEMHDRLFSVNSPVANSQLSAAAAAMGLNMPLFRHELAHHTHLPRIQEDFISGVRSGVNGTPTFYINAVRYDGEWDLASVSAALTSSATDGR